MSEPTSASDPMPTQQEMMYIRFIMTHLTGTAKLDWDTFAKKAGLKDARSASVRWSQIRKRLHLNGEEGKDKDGTVKQAKSPMVKSTPKKRQLKQDVDGLPSPMSDQPGWENEELQENVTPTKKPRKKAAPRGKAKGKDVGDGEGDDAFHASEANHETALPGVKPEFDDNLTGGHWV